MESECIFLLRRALTVSSLLLLVQLPRIYASGLVIQSKGCGVDQIAYSNSGNHELFYINGNPVDRVLFCEAIKFHYANECNFEGYLGSSYCGLNLPLGTDITFWFQIFKSYLEHSLSTTVFVVDLPLKGRRKLLETEVHNERRVSDIGQNSQLLDEKSVLTPIKVVTGSGFFVACCGFLCPCFWRKKKEITQSVHAKDPNLVDSVSSPEISAAFEKIPGTPLQVPPSPRFTMSPKINRFGSVHLDLRQITKATRNFSPSQKIGEGGFGSVYWAQLEDGTVVSIKRAKKEQFVNLQTEFGTEVELLAKIDHQNLVKLLGYVDKGAERLIVTEFVPNGTLRDHLDGKLGNILDFNQRLGISIDVAHALTYLHTYAEKKIIHRDVKSSSILLTESLRAKVADFGFARVGLESDHTHISTSVKGTIGYLDPEYMKTFQLTPKSDVYSFGILLLEILTGLRPVELKRQVDERVTLIWAFKKYNEGKIGDIMDPLMEEVVDVEILDKMFGLAFGCAAPIRSERPDMKSVGEQLWVIRADYLRTIKRGL